MDGTIFSLRYEGEGISEGLEPLAFIEVTRGFAEFITSVTEGVHGDQTPTTLKIHRLSEGSLVLEILQRLGEVTIADMLAIGASVSTEMRLALELLKHLRGSGPKETSPGPGGVTVVNNQGNVAVFNNSTVNLVLKGDAGGSVARMLYPVTSGQASRVALAVNRETVACVEQDDAPYMVSVADEKTLLDSQSEIWLTVTKPVLEGTANWTFTDGRRSFAAPIKDPDFLESVEQGQFRFGNGDRLLVHLRATQTQRGDKLRTQYEITKVQRHEPRIRSEQMRLAGI